jgi:hypothetical protein
MARTTAYWKQQILNQLEAPEVGCDSPSQVSKYNLLAYIVGASIAVFDQLLDLFRVEIDSKIDSINPATRPWYGRKALEFQNGDVVLIQLDSSQSNYLSAYYPIIDASKNIVTRVGISATADKNVLVRVAKGTDTLGPLSAPELANLQAYFDEIAPADSVVVAESIDPDLVSITGTFYYNGQYTSTMLEDIKTGVKNYLATLSSGSNFTGVFKVIDLEIYLRQITGMQDLKISDIECRQNVVAFGSGIPMVTAYTLIQTAYNSKAGYMDFDDANSTINIVAI